MSNTMAEAFCEEHLITWTEHGQDFTDWRDGDIFTGSQRMSEAGTLSLFHMLEDDHLLIVTVFPDRSWIVQQEPPGRHPAHRGNQRGRTTASWTSSTGRWRPGWTSWPSWPRPSASAGRNASRQNPPCIWMPRETNTRSSE